MEIKLVSDFFMIGHTWITVCEIDGPAIGKAFLIQKILHGKIVRMGIDPEIRALLQAEIQAESAGTLNLSA